MQLDITRIAQDLLDRLDQEHIVRKEGIVLLHNTLIAEIEALQAAAAIAPTEASDGQPAPTAT